MNKEQLKLENKRKKQLKNVGNILFTEMHMQRMTTYELSEKSGVSRPTISNIFNGDNYRIASYVDVCNALKINPFFVIRHETNV